MTKVISVVPVHPQILSGTVVGRDFGCALAFEAPHSTGGEIDELLVPAIEPDLAIGAEIAVALAFVGVGHPTDQAPGVGLKSNPCSARPFEHGPHSTRNVEYARRRGPGGRRPPSAPLPRPLLASLLQRRRLHIQPFSIERTDVDMAPVATCSTCEPMFSRCWPARPSPQFARLRPWPKPPGRERGCPAGVGSSDIEIRGFLPSTRVWWSHPSKTISLSALTYTTPVEVVVNDWTTSTPGHGWVSAKGLPPGGWFRSPTR